MKHLNELTQQELVELTDEEFEKYLAYEMMDRGILPAVPPTRIPLKEIETKTRTFYLLKHDWTEIPMLFERIEDAEVVLKAKPLVKNTTWPGSISYAKEVKWELESIQLPDEPTAKASVDVVTYNNSANEQNEKAEKEYNENSEAASEVREELRAIVIDAHQAKRQAERIRDTFNSYVSLSNGDKIVAYNFLLKAFSREDCCKAANWFPEMAGIMD